MGQRVAQTLQAERPPSKSPGRNSRRSALQRVLNPLESDLDLTGAGLDQLIIDFQMVANRIVLSPVNRLAGQRGIELSRHRGAESQQVGQWRRPLRLTVRLDGMHELGGEFPLF